ncbi:MAG TPA: SRPBCC family protein [Ktedonobacteraceae bacterium]|jgi:uncharacterized membrane protein
MWEIKARQSIFIRRPAQTIFACLSDLENMVGWSSALISVQKMTSEAVCPGTLVKSTICFFEQWMEIVFEVVEYEPVRYLSFKSIEGIVPCLFCYQFEAVQGAGTVISEEATIHLLTLPCGLTEQEVTRALGSQMEGDLQTLKQLLEASASAYGEL